MNNCIKCGKEIPEGELFCRDCSLLSKLEVVTAAGQLDEEVQPAPRAAEPRRETPQKRPVRQDTIRLDPIRTKKPVGLIAALVIAALVACLSLGYIVKTHADVTKQKNQLRSAQATAEKSQYQLTDLQTRLSDAQEEAAALASENSTLQDQVDSLNAQLHGQTSQDTQAQYDENAQKQEIVRLNTQLDAITAEMDGINAQLAEKTLALTDLQTAFDEAEAKHEEDIEAYEKIILERDEALQVLKDQVEKLETENTAYLKKTTFMDKFVVFVENDGTNYYHTYNCSRFKKEDFWVFNPSYARSEGYSPCPNCH